MSNFLAVMDTVQVYSLRFWRRLILEVIAGLLSKFKKQQSLVIKTLPKAKFHEYDDLVLHSVFNIFVNFIENDLVTHDCYTGDKDSRIKQFFTEHDQYHEFKILYYWWKNSYLKRPISTEYTKSVLEGSKLKEQYYIYANEMEHYNTIVEEIMLHKLISLRSSLWS